MTRIRFRFRRPDVAVTCTDGLTDGGNPTPNDAGTGQRRFVLFAKA